MGKDMNRHFTKWWQISTWSSVQSLSCVWLFATPWTATHQASLSITNSWSLLKLMSIESVMASNHLILCRPLPLLPSIFPSIRVFSSESALCINSVQFSHSVMSISWQSHGRQHSRPPCPLPTSRVYPNPRPLCWWWHPTILSSVIPFSFHLQSFPASGSFQRVSSPHQVAKVLEFQFQHQSFQWIFRTDFL